jgi:phage-related protein
MADLVTTLTETVTLNGSLRGSSNTVTTTGINDVMERIVTCVNSQTTTIATFAASPFTSAGAIDVDRCKYIRVTNLDADAWIEVAIVTTASNYQVLLTPGTSHILAQGEAVALAEEDTSPSFGTLENLASIQVKPVGVSFDPRVEIFVGVE